MLQLLSSLTLQMTFQLSVFTLQTLSGLFILLTVHTPSTTADFSAYTSLDTSADIFRIIHLNWHYCLLGLPLQLSQFITYTSADISTPSSTFTSTDISTSLSTYTYNFIQQSYFNFLQYLYFDCHFNCFRISTFSKVLSMKHLFRKCTCI